MIYRPIQRYEMLNYWDYVTRHADTRRYMSDQPMSISEYMKWAERWDREYDKAWGDYVNIDFNTINELENALCI